MIVESPTAHKATIRIAFTIAAIKLWSVQTISIKSTYLQGEPINRDVLLQRPVESDPPKPL